MNPTCRPLFPDQRVRFLILLLLALGLLLASGLPVCAEGDSGSPTVKLLIKPTRSVSEEDAEALETYLTILLANPRCDLRLARPGSTPDLRLEVDLMRWQRRQEPGGAPIFDTSTGQYHAGVKREILARVQARILEVETSTLIRSKELSFRQSEQTSTNPMFDPVVEVELKARSRLGNTLRKQLCKAAKQYRKKQK